MPAKSGARTSPGTRNPVTLYKLSESGNRSADRTVHVLPIMKKLIVGHPRIPGNAANQLYHFAILLS